MQGLQEGDFFQSLVKKPPIEYDELLGSRNTSMSRRLACSLGAEVLGEDERSSRRSRGKYENGMPSPHVDGLFSDFVSRCYIGHRNSSRCTQGEGHTNL